MATVDSMADELKKYIDEYSKLASSEMKESVKAAAEEAKKNIEENAPKDTGAYSKSWAVKKTMEKSNSIEMSVYSKNRYQLTHLLEYGHASRNGGRVPGKVHIEPAESLAEKTLEKELKKRLEEK